MDRAADFDPIDAYAGPPETDKPSPSNGHASANGSFRSKLMVGRWLTDRGYTYKTRPVSDGRTAYNLDRCPFDASHTGTDAAVMQSPDGKLSAKCQHDHCAGKGWKEFKAAIGAPDAHHYDPPLRSCRLRRLRPTRSPADDSEGGATTTEVEERHLTDLGNAQRMVAEFGDDIRFCHAWKKWLVWDEKRWKLDDTAEAMRMAKDTIGGLFRWAKQQIDEMQGEADGEHESEGKKERAKKIGATLAWALKSESARNLNAMVELARSEPGVPVLPQDLDSDIWLINCQNGTLDLRTGKLRPHDRADLITKLCPVEYNPDAEAPRFCQFLKEIFGEKIALISYIQRFFGYCLTGSVAEQIFAIFHGTGANGKSTLLTLLMELLGLDYAIKGAHDLLMVKSGETHPTERADLFGKRLVTTVETDDGRRMAEALVKDLTGGDRIRARRMKEDFWEFSPTHKLVLATNHRPVIGGTDHAIWRRIHLVPFNVTVTDDKKDANLLDKLRAELPGVLAWAMLGCMDWQRIGLQPPKEVLEATKEYRGEQDVLGSFIDERCLTGPNYRHKASDLYHAYSNWCKKSGEREATKTKFGLAMTEKGFVREKSGSWWYLGIAVAED